MFENIDDNRLDDARVSNVGHVRPGGSSTDDSSKEAGAGDRARPSAAGAVQFGDPDACDAKAPHGMDAEPPDSTSLDSDALNADAANVNMPDVDVPDVDLPDAYKSDLDALDAEALTTARLEADICTLAGHLAAATCRWLVLVGEFDRRGAWAAAGTRSGAQWLSWRCGMGGGTAREHIRVGRALLELPLMRAAFAAGRLSFSKIRALTRIATPALEAELVTLGLGTTAAQVDRLVREYRRAIAREDPPVPSPAVLTRRWDDDGRLVVTMRLGADEGALFIAALEAYADVLRKESAQAPTPEDSSITRRPANRSGGATEKASDDDSPPAEACPELDQTRPDSSPVEEAEALLAMAQSALARGPVDSSGADRYLVVLHADADQLRDMSAEPQDTGHEEPARRDQDSHDDDANVDGDITGWPSDMVPPAPSPARAAAPSNAAPSRGAVPPAAAWNAATSKGDESSAQPNRLVRGRCHLRGGPAVFPETLRRMACDARLRLVSHGSTGSPRDVGRGQRLVTAALRALLEERDAGRCRFPACRRRRRLHAHHIVHWADGGPTNLDNLVLLCPFHHQLVHEHGFTVSAELDGLLVFARPDGVVIATSPTTEGHDRLADLDAALHKAPVINDQTMTPEWWGDPLHVADVADGLLRLRAAGNPTPFAGATAAAAAGVPAGTSWPDFDPWSRSANAAASSHCAARKTYARPVPVGPATLYRV